MGMIQCRRNIGAHDMVRASLGPSSAKRHGRSRCLLAGKMAALVSLGPWVVGLAVAGSLGAVLIKRNAPKLTN